jgi:4-hydroxybenzoate polyprenyltransferase
VRLYEVVQLLAPGVLGLLLYYEPVQLFTPTTLLYLAAYLAHLLFTYTYNDYADYHLDRDNPRNMHRPLDRAALARASALHFVAFAALVVFLPARVAWLLAACQVAGVLYSYKLVYLKSRVPASQLAHLGTGAAYHLSGCWLHGAPVTAVHFAGAACFAVIYTSGNLHAELLDHDADADAGVRTLSVRIGRRRTLQAIFTLQVAAFLGLLPLAAPGLARAGVALLLAAYVGATPFVNRARLDLQRLYRVLVAAAITAVAAPRLLGWW